MVVRANLTVFQRTGIVGRWRACKSKRATTAQLGWMAWLSSGSSDGPVQSTKERAKRPWSRDEREALLDRAIAIAGAYEAAYLAYFRPGFHPNDRDTKKLIATWQVTLFGTAVTE